MNYDALPVSRPGKKDVMIWDWEDVKLRVTL
jgi:hypothetical protein